MSRDKRVKSNWGTCSHCGYRVRLSAKVYAAGRMVMTHHLYHGGERRECIGSRLPPRRLEQEADRATRQTD